MWGLNVLALIWVLIVPIFALVTAKRANRQAREVTARLDALEAQLARAMAARQAEPAREAAPQAPAADAAPEPAAPAVVPEPAAAAEQPTEPEPASPPPTPAPEPVAATAPKKPLETLEGRIGARWSVLIGGLALALGAVFLVRFSIEQGLIGPRMRVALGFLLSAALFAAGEALRRRDRALNAPIFAKADVPAILTGAGGVAAFATIYAAYALYGFIGSAAAFVLLTAAGLATLFLAVIHGPGLAALGLLGAYVAPLLVSSDEPKPFPVVLHTLAVTAAVLAMARIRGWRWLAIAGIVASLLWGLLTGLIVNVNTAAAALLLVAGLFALYTSTLVAGTHAPTLSDRRPNFVAIGALPALAALSLYYVLVNQAYPPLVSGILLAGALGAVASRWTSVSPVALAAALLAAFTVMLIRVPGAAGLDTIEIGAMQWTVLGDAGIGHFALQAGAIALVVGPGGFLSADGLAPSAPRTAGFLAAAGAGAPLLILIVTYLRHVPFETRPAIGIAALALAAIFAAASERLIARRPHDLAAPAPAYYASGAVLSLSFAFAVGLTTEFIPLAFALGAAGVVWVMRYRPVPVLAWLAVFLAGVALVGHPALDPAEIGTTPFLNGLILRFGLPAAGVLFAGESLRRHRDGNPAAILQAIGLALLALFVVLEIRHAANGGTLIAGTPGLGEQSALTLTALAFSLGLQRIGRQTGSQVYRAASLIAGVLGAIAIATAHFFTVNPFFTNEDVGSGHLVNLLLPGYLLPALAAAWVAAAGRGVRPRWYVLMMAALALGLGFAYVTLMVRHAFHGPRLFSFSVEDAENWTYSAVWLAFGIALLTAGIFARSTMVRAASGVVIAAVVCKVFLLDMSALTGVLRAASFLGLGAVLIVIGRLYQRLMMRGRTAAEAGG